MTIRSSNEAIRKAPKVATLELNRETLHELTESEAGDVAGGGIFRPRPPSKQCATAAAGCLSFAGNPCGTKKCVSAPLKVCTSV